jgi:hypothetical protein
MSSAQVLGILLSATLVFSTIAIMVPVVRGEEESQEEESQTLFLNVNRVTPTAATFNVASGGTFSVKFSISNDSTAGDASRTMNGDYILTFSGLTLVSGPPTSGTFSGLAKGSPIFYTWTFQAPTGPASGSITLSASVTSISPPRDFPIGGDKVSDSKSYTVNVLAPSDTTPPTSDTTPPTITISTSPDDTVAPTGWYNIESSGTDGVLVIVSASDPSGVQSITVTVVNTSTDDTTTYNFEGSSFSFTLYNGIYSVSATATDTKGNSGVGPDSTQMPVIFKIDQTPPTVNILGISDEQQFDFGDSLPSVTCDADDPMPGSGIESCTITPATLPTSVGTHTITATAKDNAGNEASTSIKYTIVAWTINGFYQPVDNPPIVNVAKAGSTIPLKFEVFKTVSREEITDTSKIVQPLKAQKISCNNINGSPTDEIYLTATGNTSLRYDPIEGQFIYNWKTPTQKDTCWKVTVYTIDGSSIYAYFKLK